MGSGAESRSSSRPSSAVRARFHLRTLKWRVENNDKLPIIFDEPRIPYRETITKAARADYRHKKQSGGRRTVRRGASDCGALFSEDAPMPDTYQLR